MAFGDDAQIILEGTFRKKGKLSASRWKQRYFVLYDTNILTYSESQTRPVIQAIDLKNVEYVQEDIKNRIIMKTVHEKKERIWSFSFDSEHLRDVWKNELMQCTKYNHVTDFVQKKQDIARKRQFIEELNINANKLKQNIQMQRRRHSPTVHGNPYCFVGSQAVKVLMELNITSITNTDEAIAFGNSLIKHNIIQSTQQTQAFTNGSCSYYFTQVNGAADATILDLESVIDNAENPQDILNLIRRCESDMDHNHHHNLKLETLYQTLCHKFESAQHYIKYETYLDQCGKVEAMAHFMNRHRFLVLPLDAIMDSKYLNQHCQFIHYDQPHTLQYNITYLQRQQSTAVPSITISSCSSFTLPSFKKPNHLHRPFNSCSFSQSVMDLKQIHAMNDIQLFAALPIPNDHPFIARDTYYDVNGRQNQFLFRLLRNREECDANNEWNAKYRFAYEEWTLYEMEQYLGLFFYKTIHEFVCHKLKHNKMPIPWYHKIQKHKSCIRDQDSKYDNDETNTRDCIEIFECIISAKDSDFPPNLNMFNVLIFVWIMYRKHSGHMKHPDNIRQRELKLIIFTKFIHKLCKEFFMALQTHKHLAKYILTLHYFASNSFDDDSVNAHTQSHMFEMALNAIKGGNSCLHWGDKHYVVQFLHQHHWVEHYKKKDTSVQFYLEGELKSVEQELNDIYQTLEQHPKYKRIETDIRIICGTIIFRQDHPHALSSTWFDANNEDDEATFEEQCAHIMWSIAKYLSPRFSQWLQRIFCEHDGVQVFELNVKSMDEVKEELCCMAKRNIKFPKSASIRDYMRCLIVFPSIEDMLNGYETLKQWSKRHCNIFRLVHMENGISKTHQRIVDNLRVIHIHALFSQQHPKHGTVSFIGEICFCLQSILRVYGMKKYIVDSYSLLLTPQKTYQTAKSLSVSKAHPDYDCRIKKLHDIQRQYLRCKSLIK
eukprot:537038_1